MRSRVDILHAENRQLRKRLEASERENRELKASLYELSLRLNLLTERTGRACRPFRLDALGSGAAQPDEGAEEEPKDPLEEEGHDARAFALKADLKGHTGAVYCARFSPSGRLLASASFDKTVRLVNAEELEQGEPLVLQEHRHSVSSIAWAHDSATLLSGSYDHTVRQWDVGLASLAATYVVPNDAFVQDVCFHPSDARLFTAATTAKQLLLYDLRTPPAAPPAALLNDSMINSAVVLPNGQHVITGDKEGLLRTWELRTHRCLSSRLVSEARKPISCVSLSPPLAARSQAMRGISGGTAQVGEDSLLAVNSYDDTLRVYSPQQYALPVGTSVETEAEPQEKPKYCFLESMHQLRGHKNRSWPIKSSVYVGCDYTRQRRPAVESGLMDATDAAEMDDPAARNSVNTAVLLATGSADTCCYVYDISGPADSGELVQRLMGHSERVYSADFHPTEPLLITASADFLVKVWHNKGHPSRLGRRRHGHGWAHDANVGR